MRHYIGGILLYDGCVMEGSSLKPVALKRHNVKRILLPFLQWFNAALSTHSPLSMWSKPGYKMNVCITKPILWLLTYPALQMCCSFLAW